MARWWCCSANHDGELDIRVIDNGRGVDPTFDLDKATGLGLSIVRTLVTTELNGLDLDPLGERPTTSMRSGSAKARARVTAR